MDIADGPADAILAAAREERVDGMAVGVRRQSGLAAAILGSVAMDLVRRSPVPVLVTREDPVLMIHEDMAPAGSAAS